MDNQRLELREISFSNEFFCEEIRDGFYISETMKHYWAAQLKVLAEIDKICRKHNLNWYADSGTLLGAVRHSGYIPWDDDVDISMLRDDFEAFISYAREELPKDYCISYVGVLDSKRNPFRDQPNAICCVANSSIFRNDHDFLKEFYGCPLMASVDIFPLDKVFLDDKKEEDRKKRGNLVYATYCGIVHNDFDQNELDMLIPMIEKDNHISIKSDNVLRELLQLFISISKECNEEDSAEIAVMYEWVMRDLCKYKNEYYSEWIEHDYENTKIRIPKYYHEILSICFGDYMKIVKGGGDHEFPLYGKYERKYREAYGRNPFRYLFDKKTFTPLENRKSLHYKIDELFKMLSELTVHSRNYAESEEWENVTALLQRCQEVAVVIGNTLEGKFGDGLAAVAVLEEYCEKVYEASNRWNDETKADLDDLLAEAEKRTKELFDNHIRDILFLPCKASWWETMSDVYEMLSTDAMNNIIVIPIPYYYHCHSKVTSKLQRDIKAFRAMPELDSKITTFDEYRLEERHPDMIIIQYPYDGYSASIGIPEILYSTELAKVTDKLVFVPFLNPEPPEADDDVAVKAMKEMVEQPAVFNSDMIIVGSEELRDYYIKSLVSMTDKELQSYWEKRICLKEELIN